MASERGMPRRLAQVSSRSRRCCGMRALTSGSWPIADLPSLRFVGFAGFVGIVCNRKVAGRVVRSLPALLRSFYSEQVPPDATGMTNRNDGFQRCRENQKEGINRGLIRCALPALSGSAT